MSDTNAEHIERLEQRPIGGALKRSFDIAFSLLASVTLLPLMAAIAVVHKLVDGGPVFFVHERIGLNGSRFGCIKFRTMVEDADSKLDALLAEDPAAAAEYARDSKLRKDPRIIPVVGKFLRSTSLDEIPQFLNVLKGDMSIVGPRPIIEREFALYGPAGADYLRSRPGITGLWQVSGRNETTFEERVSLDSDYVRSWSFGEDLNIVVKTVAVVLKREGAY
ncbi:MAG: sugar transferase [Pseudomonadota bacterium]